MLTGTPPGKPPTAGIDGFFQDTGETIQLKGIESANDNTLVKRTNDAYENAKEGGYTDVDVYVDAPNLTTEEVERRWNGDNTKLQPQRKDVNDGTLGDIWVRTKDGTWNKLPLNQPPSTQAP